MVAIRWPLALFVEEEGLAAFLYSNSGSGCFSLQPSFCFISSSSASNCYLLVCHQPYTCPSYYSFMYLYLFHSNDSIVIAATTEDSPNISVKEQSDGGSKHRKKCKCLFLHLEEKTCGKRAIE